MLREELASSPCMAYDYVAFDVSAMSGGTFR